MSIVRMGVDGSHVYVIEAGPYPCWECVGCDGPDSLVHVHRPDRFLTHLKWHVQKGHVIPDWVLEEFQERTKLAEEQRLKNLADIDAWAEAKKR